MHARFLIPAGLALLGAGVACTAFSASDGPGGDPSQTGSDGGALDGGEGGTPAVCAMLEPGAGPPPLHPVGGPLETDCGGTSVNLETSDSNCGSCGRSCGNAACIGGACAEDIVYTADGAQYLEYMRRGRFVVAGSSSVVEILPDGGQPRLLASLDGGTSAISAAPEGDADWIFRQGASAERVMPDGTVSATVSLADTLAIGFVVTPTDLLYTANTGGGVQGLAVEAIKRSDGSKHTISNEPYAAGLTRDDTSVMWSQQPLHEVEAGTTGPIVRYDVNTTGIVRTMPVAASGALGFDADYIYFFDGVARQLRRLAKSDLKNGVSELLMTWQGPENNAIAMSVFGDFIYVVLAVWPSPTGTFIARVHRCGGDPVIVARRDADNEISSAAIVLDDDVYFSAYGVVVRTRR